MPQYAPAAYEPNGPGTALGDAQRTSAATGTYAYLQAEAYKKWLHGMKVQAGAPDAGGGALTWQQQFEKQYGDPSKDIRAAYGAQESAINKQYDQMLARLGTEHGAAERGVRAEGAQLQTALKAIGADATAQLAASNRAIDNDYAKALKAVNNNYKPLSADLQANDAGGAGLHAEAAAGKANLNEAHNADAALGARYQQALSQEINNRQATGATVTTANVDDLARILTQSRDNASADRLQAVAKIEASMAGDLAQAASQKAAERYRTFLAVLKNGGTLGQAATKTASAATILSATRAAASGVPDWTTPFKGIAKSQDTDEQALANEYEAAITTGQKTPAQVWLEWQGNKDKGNMPFLDRALADALAYGTAYNQKKAILAGGISDALKAPR